MSAAQGNSARKTIQCWRQSSPQDIEDDSRAPKCLVILKKPSECQLSFSDFKDHNFCTACSIKFMKAPYVTHGFQTMLKYKPQLLDTRTNTMNRVALLKSFSAFFSILVASINVLNSNPGLLVLKAAARTCASPPASTMSS